MERDSISESWQLYQKEIAKKIKDDGVENFMNWSVIQKTMVRGDAWDTNIEREHVRTKFLHLTEKNLKLGSTVQQYHALAAAQMMGIPTLGIKHVIEIGGGIGEMARAVSSTMPNLRSHIVFDLWPVCEIQRYRFKEFGLNRSSTYSSLPLFRNEIEKIFQSAEPKEILFVSICALSEMPIKMRDRILKIGSGSNLLKNSILRVQHRWDEIDNIAYFSSMLKFGDQLRLMPCVFKDHKYLARSAS